MLKEINYKGPLIADTRIPGERKADGIIPAHASGTLQVSRDRYIIFFATLDPNGWDAVHSLVYQVRSGAPDGPVIKEDVLARAEEEWDAQGDGTPYRKALGMPSAFGVPMGATLDGKPMPNANTFVVKWYRRGMERGADGVMINSHQSDEAREVRKKLLRIEWMQFRFNIETDDIEIVKPRSVLMQKGYDSEEVFCDLGPGHLMNHAMTPPVPTDASCTTWCEVDMFGYNPRASGSGHGMIAPVEYAWNAETGFYEWTRVGDLHTVDDRAMGEPSISRWGDAWVVASRSNTVDGSTAWYRTTNLFAGLGEPTLRYSTWGPRHSYKCADGVLRIFLNQQEISPYKHKRNPLYAFEVDPVTFEYSEPKTVLDTVAEGVPFHNPFADMSKLCPNQGNRQLLVIRTIDARMTTGPHSKAPMYTDAAYDAAGIHYAEFVYDGDVADPWTFG